MNKANHQDVKQTTYSSVDVRCRPLSSVSLHPEHALAAILIAIAIAFGICSCAHNTYSMMVGKRLNIGLDPQNATANIAYEDGMAIADISRENSAFDLEVDEDVGVSIDSKTGSLKGVKRIKREIGPQVSGYLVDLAKVDSQAAQEYVKSMRAFWEYKKAVVDSHRKN